MTQFRSSYSIITCLKIICQSEISTGILIYMNKTSHQIWNSPEIAVLIFTGSAADFALNPENHWLFYTNQLPSNPQMRFLSTIQYTKRMMLASPEELPKIAQSIRNIHAKVEEKRSHDEHASKQIPNHAFKEVGDMIIDYGIRGWEYINHRKMSVQQKEEWYQDNKSFHELMGIKDLPKDYNEWLQAREKSIYESLRYNEFTDKLYAAYKKDIGPVKYWLLRKFQAEFVHPEVRKKLELKQNPLFKLAYKLYPYIPTQLDWKLVLLVLLKKEVRKFLNSYKMNYEEI